MSAPGRAHLDAKIWASRMVDMDDIYGYRARIGYASPPLLTEVFAYDFYRLAPAGVTLALTSLAILDRNKDEVDRSYEISMQAARAMASSGVDLVVLGGVTINLSRGYANADRMLADLSSELGVKVTSSAAAQNKALAALGGKKLVIARPYPQLGEFNFSEYAGARCLASSRRTRHSGTPRASSAASPSSSGARRCAPIPTPTRSCSPRRTGR